MDTRFALSSNYVDAVTSAGGIPLLLPPTLDDRAISRYVELCDGFVMTGGRDISPSRYGAETTHPTTNLLNPRRENFDFALIDAILAADKPVLGVCLGSQELNVALGGSMIQDLPSETSSTVEHKPGYREFAHEIHITTGTRMQDIVGTTTLQVNSIHHQACDRLGSGVLVMAKAPDGVVESFEVQNKNFALGVQWHPEALTTAPEHLAVYEALVKAAEQQKQQQQNQVQ
jgi:putative glutamine amidotransferase